MSDRTEYNHEDSYVTLSVKKEELGYLLSCLLHAKFNNDIKLEVVLHPVLNKMIFDVIECGKGSNMPPGFFSDQNPFLLPKEELQSKTSIFYQISTAVRELAKPDDYNGMLSKAFYPYVFPDD